MKPDVIEDQSIKNPIVKFWRKLKTNAYERAAVKLSFFFLGTLILIDLIFFWRLPPKIPLFYSRPWGEAQLASPLFLFLLTGTVMALVLMNLLVTAIVYNKERLLSQILLWINVLLVFLINVSVLKVVLMIV